MTISVCLSVRPSVCVKVLLSSLSSSLCLSLSDVEKYNSIKQVSDLSIIIDKNVNCYHSGH